MSDSFRMITPSFARWATRWLKRKAPDNELLGRPVNLEQGSVRRGPFWGNSAAAKIPGNRGVMVTPQGDGVGSRQQVAPAGWIWLPSNVGLRMVLMA